ncbi:hypothetical protein WJX81_003666 [Elliptochloris bilobata]|uniref:Non-specific serine/threonine protein kinase n=1 Tax=Elliptochloris bilobata TaxID=381761 RepID=A0AAW1REJ6_9CHLO
MSAVKNSRREVRAVALAVLQRQTTRLEGLAEDLCQNTRLLKELLGADEGVQANTHALLATLLPRLPKHHVGSVMDVVLLGFTGHSNPRCRSQYFVILRDAWQQHDELRPRLRPPLLALLGDPDPALRSQVLHFWNTALSGSLPERLRELLADSLDGAGQWAARLERQWASSTVALCLALARPEKSYSASLFTVPLAECEFSEYSIDTTSQNTLGVAPLFSQQWEASQALADEPEAPKQARAGMVRATLGGTAAPAGFSFSLALPEASLSAPAAAASASATQLPPGQASASIPGLAAHQKVFRRLTKWQGAGGADLGRVVRRREAAKRATAARESKVALLRQYRKGELPDIIGLSPASFFDPLGITTSRNSALAAQLLQALYTAALDVASADQQARLRAALAACFERGPSNPGYVAALQRLALADRGAAGIVTIPAAAAAAVASGGLQAGVLQVEEALLFGGGGARDAAGEPERKKRRHARVAVSEPAVRRDESAWALLCDMYSQLGEDHLAQVAQAAHIARCPGTQEATAAYGARRVAAAFSLYEALMEAVTDGSNAAGPAGKLQASWLLGGQEPSASEEAWWFAQRMRCLEELGAWGELLVVVDMELDDRAEATGAPAKDSLLFDSSDDWRGPKYLRPFVLACLFQNSNRQRLTELLSSAATNKSRRVLLEGHAAVELAAAAAMNCAWDECQAEIEAGWQQFRSRWGALDRLSEARRLDTLTMLQPLAELQEAVDLLQRAQADPGNFDAAAELSALAARWQGRWPGPAARSAAACLIVANVREGLLEALDTTLKRSGGGAWQEVVRLRREVALDGAVALERQGFLDAAQDLLGVAGASVGLERFTEAQLRIRLSQVHATPGSTELRQKLQMALAAMLKAAPAAADAKAALRLALLCNHLLRDTDEGNAGANAAAQLTGTARAMAERAGGVAALFVRSLLQAMRLGGGAVEAQLLVPRALGLLGGAEQAPRDEWAAGWGRVPLYALLPWGAQMLSLLDGAAGDALLPALQALARSNKQSLYFAFGLSRQHYGKAGKRRAAVLEPLLASGAMERFADELHALTLPLQRWQGWQHRLEALILSRDLGAAFKLYAEEAFPDVIGRHLLPKHVAPVTVNQQVAAAARAAFEDDRAFGQGGKRIASMDQRTFNAACTFVTGKLARSSDGKVDLARLSPWMAAYTATADEGEDAPEMPWMPSMAGLAAGAQAPVRITGFGQSVRIFASKQKPIKITIYGDDFREVEWIVKGGEELRLDQRMEQFLDVANGLLARDPGATAHRLQVRTYAVVPVRSSLGMVEFVGDTQPLKQAIMQPSLVTKEDAEKADASYLEGVTKLAGPGKTTLSDQYMALLQANVRSEAVVSNLHAAEACVRWDALREVLLRYAGSAEAFLALRRAYLASLAAISATGYISGSGDRHLENFLLHSATGALVPIDFGYSFGTAVGVLPIPELAPFRLTRQLRGALQPHDASALLAAPLASGLAALRAGRDALEGILEVYLREPLVEWQREARVLQAMRRKKRDASPAEPGSSVADISHISEKIGVVSRKLAGQHPAEILITELTARHAGTKHWSALQALVRGDAAHDKRAAVLAKGNANLSEQEQAVCLLEMATDAKILGRAYSGWRPWL